MTPLRQRMIEDHCGRSPAVALALVGVALTGVAALALSAPHDAYCGSIRP
jgi:hypothetical protein